MGHFLSLKSCEIRLNDLDSSLMQERSGVFELEQFFVGVGEDKIEFVWFECDDRVDDACSPKINDSLRFYREFVVGDLVLWFEESIHSREDQKMLIKKCLCRGG